MNTQKAQEQSDAIITTEVGSASTKRFVYHAESGKPIKHNDSGSPAKCGIFDILHCKMGAPGNVIWYCKRVI